MNQKGIAPLVIVVIIVVVAVVAGTSIYVATRGGGGGENQPGGPTATLVSIAVTPVNPSIAAGNTEQFAASGTYSDETTQDITTQVTWNSSDISVATVNSSGLATAVAAGTATITATFLGSISGSTTLTVTSGGGGTYSGGPIRIQSDDQFTGTNGVVSGSGTQSNPYVIEGWTIDASTASTDNWPYIKVGIAVSQTSKYFVIRNCRVENAKAGYGVGISLSFLSNGSVQNCVLGNTYTGVELDSCSNVVISGNTISGCEDGISNGTYSSDSIMISNNTITGSTGTGIEFHYLTNSSASGNTVNNGADGIYVSAIWFGGCTISNNTVQGNTYEGIDVSSDSENVTISNNNTSNNGGTGIAVYGSHNTIENNVSNGNNEMGINLDYTGLTDMTASYNTVSNNTASNNGTDGLSVGSGCAHNTISNNTCLSNNALGEYYNDGTPWYYDISINAQPNTLEGNNYGTIYIYSPT